jgi:hypothetical protein
MTWKNRREFKIHINKIYKRCAKKVRKQLGFFEWISFLLMGKVIKDNLIRSYEINERRRKNDTDKI